WGDRTSLRHHHAFPKSSIQNRPVMGRTSSTVSFQRFPSDRTARDIAGAASASTDWARQPGRPDAPPHAKANADRRGSWGQARDDDAVGKLEIAHLKRAEQTG